MKLHTNGKCCNLQPLLALLAFAIFFIGCEKFLDKKPDQKLATPSTLDDLEALLNNYESINPRFPVSGEIACDDYYVTDATFGRLDARYRNFYLWQKYDDIGGDWGIPYRTIFTTNIILESLNDIHSSDIERANRIRGSALFIRGFNHFALSQIFCVPYNSKTAKEDYGIPLRLHSDLSITPVRATVAATYESIISHLKNAAKLLPAKINVRYMPSRPAAFGLLSRVYLSMRDYENAGLYADSALQLYNVLMDYNNIDATAFVPFSQFNDEVIYDAATMGSVMMIQSRAKVDTVLYAMYDDNDLRKTSYFRLYNDGSHSFKGNYTGRSSASLFTGIATDELYLTRAECAARKGEIASALNDLNTLLANRWQEGSFVPLSSTNPEDILDTILVERRKELLFRTLRWTDLRRLNLEPEHAQTIYRFIDGKKYSLPPGSPRYTFQIDRISINLSGMPQNP